MGLVYGYRSKTTGKWYIGQTNQTLTERAGTNGWRYTIKSHTGRLKHPKFANAIKLYGWEDFEVQILAESSDQNVLDKLEKEFIKEKDSVNNGYNVTLGGQNGHKMTREICKNFFRPVAMCDKETSIDIMKFESITDAASFVGLKNTNDITRCCKGTQFSAGGYRWRYLEEQLPNFEKKKGYRSAVKVKQFSKDKKLLASFSSITEAQEKTGFSKLGYFFRNNIFFVHGFLWEIYPSKKKHRSIKIFSKELNMTFDSAREAARKIGKKNSHSTISKAAKNNGTAFGYTWKIVEENL